MFCRNGSLFALDRPVARPRVFRSAPSLCLGGMGYTPGSHQVGVGLCFRCCWRRCALRVCSSSYRDSAPHLTTGKKFALQA